MKKILCFVITVALLLTSTSVAFAKPHNEKKNNHHDVQQENKGIKENDHSYKMNGSPVIKYERYKLPLSPITKGMGAKVTYDKSTAVLTVVKGDITIVIDFKNKTVNVNGVQDNNSGIFTARYDRGMTVLIKYIARILGIRVCVDDDEVTVEVPGLDLPTNVTVTSIGTVMRPNTLNSSSIALSATANITAGQATGGRAELYVGSKLVATDASIAATDTTVTFTTSDGSPVNAELQAAVPSGGVVTVKLYDAYNRHVTSANGNPTLMVDFVAPTLYAITSATYDASAGKLHLFVSGASANGDIVDVTKISFTDSALGKTYQLTNTTGLGSSGVVKNANTIEINIGTLDKIALAGFGSAAMYITVAPGSLLTDAAGNTSPVNAAGQTIPVGGSFGGLDVPTYITITPFGGTIKANTLNSTNLALTVSANITVGQAVGGRAELYVGSKLVATDSYITATDTTVTFTTSDGSPTNAELQAAVPTGGSVSVKLYNASNYSVVSNVNPTLTVDYVAPTLSSVNSVIYDVSDNELYFIVTGVGAEGDAVDVTKITLFDTTLGKTYQLTNAQGTGSNGKVYNANSLRINLGSLDRIGLNGFGTTTVYLTISAGSLITDAAGNVSPTFASSQTLLVNVIK